jgi:hypothetical protein
MNALMSRRELLLAAVGTAALGGASPLDRPDAGLAARNESGHRFDRSEGSV